jgi:hypothetical protein
MARLRTFILDIRLYSVLGPGQPNLHTRSQRDWLGRLSRFELNFWCADLVESFLPHSAFTRVVCRLRNFSQIDKHEQIFDWARISDVAARASTLSRTRYPDVDAPMKFQFCITEEKEKDVEAWRHYVATLVPQSIFDNVAFNYYLDD